MLSYILLLSNLLILAQNKITTATQFPEPKFEHFSLEQGFSQSSVFSILQDSQGFLWFGTVDGLNRYDGYNFKVFRNNPDDTTSISNNSVISVYLDNAGVLWLGTEGGGLNRYDKETGIFTRFIHNSNDPNSLSNNAAFGILEDKSGVLWIGTNGGGLNKLIPGKSEDSPPAFVHYNHNPQDKTSLSSDFIGPIYEDKSGTIWIGTEVGLDKLIPGKQEGSPPSFVHFKHNPDDPTSLSGNVVYSIFEDHAGVLWIATFGGGLNKLVPGEGKKRPPAFIRYQHNPKDITSISSNKILSIYEDNSRNLWIGTAGGGLNKFNRATEEFIHYKFDPNDSRSLNGNWVYTIFEDKSGVLWIGTMPGGLNKFDPMKGQFKHYKHDEDNPKSLSGNRIFSMYEDRSGNLWIGTYPKGLNMFVPDNDKNPFPSFVHYTNDPKDPASLGNSTVWSIYEDKSGSLWFGTTGSGLMMLSPTERGKSSPALIHYEHDPDDPTSLSHNRIRSIHEDVSGNLWIGTNGGGLNRFVQGDGKNSPPTFVRYLHTPDDSTSLSNNIIWTIYEDSHGFLWIGTAGGLNRYVSADDKHSPPTFIHYKHDPDDPESLSSNTVISIYEDHSGNLWIGTEIAGLNRFDREKDTFIRYKEEDGLPNNTISGMLEDSKGNLWLSTRNGLSRFNPMTETFRNYVAKDGLQNNEFQIGACVKSRSGEMFFGGNNGFNRFHPDSIKDNVRIPPIVITDFQLFNKSVPVGLGTSTNRSILNTTITETSEIELSYKDYIISFEFAALDFHIPEKNKYAYILDGFEKRWNYTDANRRFATYTNLDPGEYTFRVKASNNDGIWNEAGTSLEIIIIPPWWATWWAYAFYVIVFSSILYGVRKYEMNRMNWKNQFKLDEVKLKEREETDKMK
ncbi:MAG: hypothetical protein KAI29_16590, partial [Cyclobacteriaceae bacterium]|nr:hypothetical protein [Cyclobacteriaceae bacterium]